LSAVSNQDSTCRLSYERQFGERARPLRTAHVSRRDIDCQRKRPGVARTPGLMALQRVGPSVIVAYFFRLRAHNLADHLPRRQMSRATIAPGAISV
jgi:hypothetical protein